MGFLSNFFGNSSQREIKRLQPLVDRILALEDTYRAMDEATLRGQTAVLKGRLAAGESLDDILPEAFATCREAADRVLGERHYPVQLMGGILLHRGTIAEMRTGEGKTLVSTLPAYLNALEGKGVHVVTVNDYLARRDSEWMGKVYRYLGLTVGLIVNGLDSEARKAAYAADITYGTNNELGFDYLRDNMVVYRENKVQRGHHFAIVDEVDSILIDEARTPLIISGRGEKSTDLYVRADAFARSLRCHRIKEMDDKREAEEIDGDYLVDEKARTATLLQPGVKKAEGYFGVENLMDAENVTLLHHINQAIKARGVMQRDVDYVVKDGQVLIVDEFTGRIMYGRRYNEGLHQAIEAKEGVTVANESKTLATITFQNFFRLYKKLSGMTGTALTEADEFQQIYHLGVVEVPTNRPVQRVDMPDTLYCSEDAKFRAVIEQIKECYARRQPVLVGTISIEKSERLSAALRRAGVPHEVLNAKQHEREAEIVAQAGKSGAVTIATNMAGRGTDIKLGGNPEYLAKAEMRRLGYSEELIAESSAYGETDSEEILAARAVFRELDAKYRAQIQPEAKAVRAAGGLFIIGTERHESRRIDNQLRGRSGRQGDPGTTRFYLSAEDDLLRLFGGDRFQNIMAAFRIEDDMPIDMALISKTIENAQRRMEERNFGIRRNVLQYDDVMNRQREIIYGQRDKVLDDLSVRDSIMSMIDGCIEDGVARYTAGDAHEEWNMVGLREYFLGWLTGPDDLQFSAQELEDLDRSDLVEMLRERARARYEDKEARYGEIMREVERNILLRTVDRYWMDHIDNMDELRRGIHLRAYGQHDPVVLYRIEGFDMFDRMIAAIREDTARAMLAVEIRTQEAEKRVQTAQPTMATNGDGTDRPRPARRTAAQKVGRNDPCPCGSGKKYKKCCGANVVSDD